MMTLYTWPGTSKSKIDIVSHLDINWFMLMYDNSGIVELVFLKSRILIYCDAYLGNFAEVFDPLVRGWISTPGHALEWFTQDLTDEQIGRAFLTPIYDPQKARTDVLDYAEALIADGKTWDDWELVTDGRKMKSRVARFGEAMFATENTLRENLKDLFFAYPEDAFGISYPEGQLSILVTIHDQFTTQIRNNPK